VYSVCPDYVDPVLVLAENQVEAEYLKLKLDAAAVPASATKVREILRNREVDILHFIGHSVANPRNVGGAKILLQGRNVGRGYAREYLSATTVEETAELAGEDGAGPLVALNACQVGISGEELSSLGGFARAFLEAGAQAFVSCRWSVQGRPSRIFVETLYNRLLSEGDHLTEQIAELDRQLLTVVSPPPCRPPRLREFGIPVEYVTECA
jgi:CHAT domain-containing protein